MALKVWFSVSFDKTQEWTGIRENRREGNSKELELGFVFPMAEPAAIKVGVCM
jgi:hypothetical protein